MLLVALLSPLDLTLLAPRARREAALAFVAELARPRAPVHPELHPLHIGESVAGPPPARLRLLLVLLFLAPSVNEPFSELATVAFGRRRLGWLPILTVVEFLHLAELAHREAVVLSLVVAVVVPRLVAPPPLHLLARMEKRLLPLPLVIPLIGGPPKRQLAF